MVAARNAMTVVNRVLAIGRWRRTVQGDGRHCRQDVVLRTTHFSRVSTNIFSTNIQNMNTTFDHMLMIWITLFRLALLITQMNC
jgi:hypothetical protein